MCLIVFLFSSFPQTDSSSIPRPSFIRQEEKIIRKLLQGKSKNPKTQDEFWLKAQSSKNRTVDADWKRSRWFCSCGPIESPDGRRAGLRLSAETRNTEEHKDLVSPSGLTKHVHYILFTQNHS